ncbi:MAG: FMN-binding protein [Actinomycetia bacterium]|nr:FMN-binding protein [Actinomycetes bacterium]
MTTSPTVPRPTRRKHPSRGARVVALVSSVVATGGIGAALAHADQPGLPTVVTQAVSASTGSSATTPSTATTTGSTYADGTWTGGVADMKYGPVQVQATVSGGKVTAVALLQEPSDRKSQRINSQAAPILESEAVAAQSAHLDVVSGATYTSVSYEASLQSALDLAAQQAAQPAAQQ